MAPLRLEIFPEARQEGEETVVTDLTAMEEARLASYEQGYSAGWEDAAAAQNEDKERLSADLAHNLQALGFTYHEARIHVLRALEPLLLEMTRTILPEIARQGLPEKLVELLLPFAEDLAGQPVKLLFNPAARGAIEPVLTRIDGLPLQLVEEPTLGEGQVYMRLGDCEQRLDLDSAIAEIASAITDFLTLTTKDSSHG